MLCSESETLMLHFLFLGISKRCHHLGQIETVPVILSEFYAICVSTSRHASDEKTPKDLLELNRSFLNFLFVFWDNINTWTDHPCNNFPIKKTLITFDFRVWFSNVTLEMSHKRFTAPLKSSILNILLV